MVKLLVSFKEECQRSKCTSRKLKSQSSWTRQAEAEKQTYGQGPPPDFVTGDLRAAWDWISKNSRDESEAKPVKESRP
jgi:hypothetical protein